jgi:hypothetical protein
MYPNGTLQNSSSGERHASHQHYSMSQVNNEKPVIQRESEEQNQTWGQPPSLSSPSFYPSNIDSVKNFSHANRLDSSSSSLFDRNNTISQDNYGANNSNSYQQQTYRGIGQSTIPLANTYGQRSNTSSSYSKISNITSQQPGIQHFHDVPYYHGFKFQTIPGFFFCANEKRIVLISFVEIVMYIFVFCFRHFTI